MHRIFFPTARDVVVVRFTHSAGTSRPRGSTRRSSFSKPCKTSCSLFLTFLNGRPANQRFVRTRKPDTKKPVFHPVGNKAAPPPIDRWMHLFRDFRIVAINNYCNMRLYVYSGWFFRPVISVYHRSSTNYTQRILSWRRLSRCRGHRVGPCLIVCWLSRCSGRYHSAIARKARVIARFLGRTAHCRFYDPTYPGFIHGQPSFHGKFLVTIVSPRLVLFLAFRVFRVAKKTQRSLERSRKILKDRAKIRKKRGKRLKVCLCVFGNESNFYRWNGRRQDFLDPSADV